MSFVCGDSGRRFEEHDLGVGGRPRAAGGDGDRQRAAVRGSKPGRGDARDQPAAAHVAGDPRLDLGSQYRPAGTGNEVAGDFYDVFAGDRRDWFAVVGDVSGKGAEAAAVMALARYTVRTAALGRSRPSEILLHPQRGAAPVGVRAILHGHAAADPARLGDRPTDGLSGGHRGRSSFGATAGSRTWTPTAPCWACSSHRRCATSRSCSPTTTRSSRTPTASSRSARATSSSARDRLGAVLAGCVGVPAADIAQRIVRAVEAFRADPPADDIAVLAYAGRADRAQAVADATLRRGSPAGRRRRSGPCRRAWPGTSAGPRRRAGRRSNPPCG